MILYIAVQYDYDLYQILGVYDNVKSAEDIIERIEKKDKEYDYRYKIETFEINKDVYP